MTIPSGETNQEQENWYGSEKRRLAVDLNVRVFHF